MTDAVLFHVAERDTWEEALREGAYPWSTRGVPFAAAGFVHLSRADQVAGTLQRFFGDVDGPLVVLVVDPGRAEAPVTVEDGYPHLQGPLIIPAVVDVRPVGRDAAGRPVAPVGPGTA